MSDDTAITERNAEKPIPFSDFLENSPPNSLREIAFIATAVSGYMPEIVKPQLNLHCSSEQCNGSRFFRSADEPIQLGRTGYGRVFLEYFCANCQNTCKTYALLISLEGAGATGKIDGRALKLGEAPIFGPHTSSKLIKLIGPDRENFLNGRRCENQGLGIGAFAYYRRVVENQKDRILNKIIDVSEKVGAPKDRIDELRKAVKETQFSTAMDIAKDSMPESLLINGHSPILLLHSALSEGIHALSDAECLEMASNIRIVLNELSDRLAQALKDESELNDAITSLMKKKGG